MSHRIVFIAVAAALMNCTLAGCNANRPLNPSFPLTTRQAKLEWKQMKAGPKPFERPVLVLGGAYDPGFVAHHIADELRDVASNRAMVVPVSFFDLDSFEESAQRVILELDGRYPSDDDLQTVEVDVVAFSMGGLVARLAAVEPLDPDVPSRKRLRIVRLFTIATPHQGAAMAWIPTFDSRVLDMRAHSEFLQQLNAASVPYEAFTYARLGDWVVGTANAAMPERSFWWVAPGVSFSHAFAGYDDRILADIARRLRGETPYATQPAAPLPD